MKTVLVPFIAMVCLSLVIMYRISKDAYNEEQRLGIKFQLSAILLFVSVVFESMLSDAYKSGYVMPISLFVLASACLNTFGPNSVEMVKRYFHYAYTFLLVVFIALFIYKF